MPYSCILIVCYQKASNSTPKNAKRAVRALATHFQHPASDNDSDPAAVEILQDLYTSLSEPEMLDVSNPQLPSVLRGVAFSLSLFLSLMTCDEYESYLNITNTDICFILM